MSNKTENKFVYVDKNGSDISETIKPLVSEGKEIPHFYDYDVFLKNILFKKFDHIKFFHKQFGFEIRVMIVILAFFSIHSLEISFQSFEWYLIEKINFLFEIELYGNRYYTYSNSSTSWFTLLKLTIVYPIIFGLAHFSISRIVLLVLRTYFGIIIYRIINLIIEIIGCLLLSILVGGIPLFLSISIIEFLLEYLNIFDFSGMIAMINENLFILISILISITLGYRIINSNYSSLEEKYFLNKIVDTKNGIKTYLATRRRKMEY